MEKEKRRVRVNPLLVTANITGILCLICCIATLFIMITGNKTEEPEEEADKAEEEKPKKKTDKQVSLFSF